MTAPADIAVVLANARTAADSMAIELKKRGSGSRDVDDRVANIVVALYELARLDVACTDLRRRVTVQIGEQVLHAHESGASLEELAARFGVTKPRISQLLEEGRSVTRLTDSCSAPAARGSTR